jgi:hypothetical protein
MAEAEGHVTFHYFRAALSEQAARTGANRSNRAEAVAGRIPLNAGPFALLAGEDGFAMNHPAGVSGVHPFCIPPTLLLQRSCTATQCGC